jgi:hypothetical protein
LKSKAQIKTDEIIKSASEKNSIEIKVVRNIFAKIFAEKIIENQNRIAIASEHELKKTRRCMHTVLVYCTDLFLKK